MNKRNSASILDGRDRASIRPTPFRIAKCGRRTTMGIDDGFAFDLDAGRRTVAFLASSRDPDNRLVDLAVVAAVCSDDGTLVDHLGELLVSLPPDACLNTMGSEAPWRRTLDQALQIVDVVVAHDAWAQRQAVEAVHDGFARHDWGCSRHGIDWRGLGFPSDHLADISGHVGLQPQGWRAIDQCRLLLDVLTRPDEIGTKPQLAQLLASVDTENVRLFAGDVPAAHMPALLRRGYRWSPGQNGAPEGFFVDRARDAAQAERRFLAGLLGRDEADLLERQLPASERYRLP